MLEEVTKNTARNITNGILLQVCDLQKVEKCDKSKEKEKDASPEKMTKKDIKGAPNAVTMFASEFIGTGLLMFIGCMGCVPEFDNPAAVHHMASLTFGLVILLIIQTFGHISGAHLNPAVTFAAVFMKLVSPMMSIVYIAAQFLGATLGFALLKVLLPTDFYKDGFCMTLPHPKITAMQALAIETIISTTLILIVCAVWDKRNEKNTDSTPLRFALIIAGISMAAGPLTGASMNTARTFAPALLLGNFKDQWVYWIGPNIGAILGCGIYKVLFALPEEEEPQTRDEVLSLQDVKSEKS
ncbi:aquaporin AQPAe.a-like isoform X1 [Diabrotica virgifera virgifera]|uniref:Aquaporin AQPAe.a-like n=1 Tax=Diabrotica virgifera virgifera TaxID=50390 RepID=A0ABM5KL21_DIAVI|nr:aquaporin AQPAe.a-like isoform X1 [Diabrotica virgifera virgifera]XP_050510895.1 aquaporin AQPAe.a-like isoform X1 [Diabrotica virgifera virgifera]XP_050510896.1 aquaporin AQPAe.a-like isoform X1 [Diabrotica virgifera virgifera]